jgi:hypothetical protein
LQEASVPVIPVSVAITLDANGRPRLDDVAIVNSIRGGPARLEVRATDKTVLIDGMRQNVPGRPFQLLLLLVEKAVAGGGLVRSHDFERYTQREISDVLRELKRALTARRSNAGEIEAWFNFRRAFGVELILDPSQIELIP